MLARDFMSTELLTTRPDQGFNRVEILAELKHVRHIPVVDEENKLVGMVSIRDLLSHLSNAAASHFCPIEEVMNRDLVTASGDTDLKEIVALMRERNVGCVCIVDAEKKLVGLISDRDFLTLAE